MVTTSILLEQVGFELDHFPFSQTITWLPINFNGGLHLKVTFALLRKSLPSFLPLSGDPGSLHRAVKEKLQERINMYFNLWLLHKVLIVNARVF